MEREGRLLFPRYGAWKERYFRTEGFVLHYYTENMNLIKANELQGKVKGPYRYKPVGSPSESVDLRNSDARIERGEGDESIFFVKHLGKVLEVKALDEEQCGRWLTVVQNIIDTERSKRKQVGTLTVEVDGCFVIGGGLATTGTQAKLSLHLRNETIESDAARVEVEDKLSYENLDESHDSVGRCDLKMKAELPMWQTSMSLEWKLLPVEAQQSVRGRESDAKTHNSPGGKRERRRSSVAAFAAAVGSALKGCGDEPSVACRKTTLFELQAENAVTYMGAHRRYRQCGEYKFDHATAASSLEGDVSADPFWPAFAPDGSAPKAGFRWYALYDLADPEAVDKDGNDKPLRVRALLHAKIHYLENVINVVDPDGHPRYEAQDDHEEFKSELLTNGMQRLSSVADEFAEIGAFLGELLAWDKPVQSLVGWFVLAGSIVALPDHSALAIFPLLMVITLLLGLPKALRGDRVRESIAVDDGDGALNPAEEQVQRAIAEVNVSVLKGRNLVAADAHLTAQHSSDPYVVVIALPPPPLRFANHKLSEMLVGMSSVKSQTLNPEWLNPGADDAAGGRDSAAASTHHKSPRSSSGAGGSD